MSENTTEQTYKIHAYAQKNEGIPGQEREERWYLYTLSFKELEHPLQLESLSEIQISPLESRRFTDYNSMIAAASNMHLVDTETLQVFAQSTNFAMNKPIDTTEEFKQMLINMSISQIQHNMTDPIITIWDDGTYSISDNSFVDGRSITISVMAESPFTTQNGYKIDNGKLIAPNGTVIFPDVR